MLLRQLLFRFFCYKRQLPNNNIKKSPRQLQEKKRYSSCLKRITRTHENGQLGRDMWYMFTIKRRKRVNNSRICTSTAKVQLGARCTQRNRMLHCSILCFALLEELRVSSFSPQKFSRLHYPTHVLFVLILGTCLHASKTVTVSPVIKGTRKFDWILCGEKMCSNSEPFHGLVRAIC
jgi:hypothetical protein